MARVPKAVTGYASGLVGLAALTFGLLTLFHTFWGYRDSPAWIYVVWGLFWIALGLVFAGLAWLALHRREPS